MARVDVDEEDSVDNDVLRQAPLFSALDDEAATALRSSMAESRLRRGDVLFHEGDSGDKLYIVLDGKVKLGRTSSDGRENLLAILGPGQMFGELSLFDPGPRSATVTAVTDASFASLSHEDLLRWLEGRPIVARGLLAQLAGRLRKANDVVADLVFSDVPGRVAKALLDLADRFGRTADDGVHVHHDLTQEELAQLVGASRETVNKALADFASRGWLRLEPRSVVIMDVERLAPPRPLSSRREPACPISETPEKSVRTGDPRTAPARVVRGERGPSADATSAEDDFHAFVVARTPALSRTAYLLTGDAHLAEDLVQTALFKAARAWHRIQGQPEAVRAPHPLHAERLVVAVPPARPETALSSYDAPAAAADTDLRLTPRAGAGPADHPAADRAGAALLRGPHRGADGGALGHRLRHGQVDHPAGAGPAAHARARARRADREPA